MSCAAATAYPDAAAPAPTRCARAGVGRLYPPRPNGWGYSFTIASISFSQTSDILAAASGFKRFALRRRVPSPAFVDAMTKVAPMHGTL